MAKNWAWAALPLLVLGLALFIVPGVWVQGRAYVFVAALLLLAAELMVIGWLVNDRPVGAFIDNRNMVSVSKLQAGGWTVVILAAFATVAAFNAAVPHADCCTVTALQIQIPNDLLLAMGISATSLVAAPALLSLKSTETPTVGAEQGAADRTGTTVIGNGKVLTKQSPADASWADVVTGDELGNAGTPDLGKIQQALITLVLLGTYAGFVFRYLLNQPPTIGTLPLVDTSFVWLLGISHASYLAYKAAPHTKSGDSA